MPWYQTDNLTTWIFTVFTEEYENADTERQIELMKAIDGPGLYPLRAYAHDAICDLVTDVMLLCAIENSIDIQEFKRLLMEWANDNTCRNCYAYTDGDDCEKCYECRCKSCG
jgi:hypothetical protein